MADSPYQCLQRIRLSCAQVAEGARAVRLVRDRAREVASSLRSALAAPVGLDAGCHYLGRGADTVCFILVLDSINFGSGYFPKLRKRPGYSGYFTIATALTEQFRRHGAFTADALAALSQRDCLDIFGQDAADPDIRELMGLFARSLNDLGRYVRDRYAGSFTNLVEAAGGSAAALVDLLASMPYFDDRQPYDGQWVHFYKRAQLTAADLAQAVPDTAWGWFHDLDCLTSFADNLVPHVLRLEGVLEYEPRLVRLIEAGTLLPADSAEEVELRACAVHAVELLRAELATQGVETTAMALDHALWNRGQSPAFKAVPRHRTRTVFY